MKDVFYYITNKEICLFIGNETGFMAIDKKRKRRKKSCCLINWSFCKEQSLSLIERLSPNFSILSGPTISTFRPTSVVCFFFCFNKAYVENI